MATLRFCFFQRISAALRLFPPLPCDDVILCYSIPKRSLAPILLLSVAFSGFVPVLPDPSLFLQYRSTAFMQTASLGLVSNPLGALESTLDCNHIRTHDQPRFAAPFL